MKNNQREKAFEYAAILSEVVLEVLQREDIQDELEDSDNATAFIHALANCMPTIVFNSIVGDKKSNLQFNHLANQLVFQFSELV